MIPHSQKIEDLKIPLNFKGNSLSFPELIEDFCINVEKIVRQEIKQFLEDMDHKFRYSKDRVNNYYVNKTAKRTIICMYGEITYSRTIYKDRSTDKLFCYVDEKLGIDKYIRYTNDVACYAAEAYSDENSMIKIGNESGNLIHAKFSLCDNRIYNIPRQTIYNILKRVKPIRIKPEEDKKRIETLNILLDEKYLPDNKKVDTEGNIVKSSKMTKAALIVEGLDKANTKRHKYINPQYYSVYKSDDFLNELLEYLDDHYELDKLKYINVLADGAKWIKTIANDMKLPYTITTQYLDKFHFHQSLWRICKDKDLYDKAVNYLYHNDKKDLYVLLDSLNKTDNDLKNINYIKNNYELIQNTIHLKNMNCAMEQAVSHHIHSQFDNVPKVYSDDGLKRYLSFRDNYRNNENMKILFLLALQDKDKETDKTVINKKPLNTSFFDKQIKTQEYSVRLANGKKIVSFSDPGSLSFI